MILLATSNAIAWILFFIDFISIWQCTNLFDIITLGSSFKQSRTRKKRTTYFDSTNSFYDADADNNHFSHLTMCIGIDDLAFVIYIILFRYEIQLHTMCNMQYLYINVGNFRWKWIDQIRYPKIELISHFFPYIDMTITGQYIVLPQYTIASDSIVSYDATTHHWQFKTEYSFPSLTQYSPKYI